MHYVSTLELFLSSVLVHFVCIHGLYILNLYKLDLPYLCIIITNHYYMYLIVETHFVLCLLLSNDKFYVHSGGSLEY